MITDDELLTLPDDPEEAFVKLEACARRHLNHELSNLLEQDDPDALYRQYMSTVLGAVSVFKIDALGGWALPSGGDYGTDLVHQFIADVDHCTMQIRLLHARRVKQYSVVLDIPTKKKLRHYIDQIRETIDKLEVSQGKKDRLYSKVEALALEIDRDRTRYQAIAALFIEAADDAGEAASRLEPVVQLVERIGAAIGIAKRAQEDQAKLPPPTERKRIEPPKKAAPRQSSFDKELDDEIPF